MTDGAPLPPGWHGKLPSLGDFASRRLDDAFIEPWDRWLAAGIAALRDRDPTGWLDAYLASPSWRFLLLPGALPGAAGAQGWAGVLMPSVDRVGRYFPLTIVQPLGDKPGTTQQMALLWHWLGRLDELAADAMHDDWSVDQLEAELARMAGADLGDAALAAGSAPLAGGALVELRLPPGGSAALQIGSEAQAAWSDKAAGLAYWFACPEHEAPRLAVSRGLPAALGTLLGATI